jgi:4-hydroxybutyryl-CoA dehydratase/vinylacetyl-CoA-Delta-isomerase
MWIVASALMPRANGLSTNIFTNKLVEMSISNQVTSGLGERACDMGSAHPSGSWFADSLTAYTNKVVLSKLPYETLRVAQNIGEGIQEIGSIPSYRDLSGSEYGLPLEKELKAVPCSSSTKFKATRLRE